MGSTPPRGNYDEDIFMIKNGKIPDIFSKDFVWVISTKRKNTAYTTKTIQVLALLGKDDNGDSEDSDSSSSSSSSKSNGDKMEDSRPEGQDNAQG